MSDVADTVDSLFRNIISLLRYVFPPIVGFLVIFVGLGCKLAGKSEYVSFATSNVSLTLLFIVAFGLTVYHMHRAVIHLFISLVIMGIVRLKVNGEFGKPPMCELNFARWIRRSMQDKAKPNDAHAVQTALDIANAGTHFLYCSSWSALVWFCVFKCCLGCTLTQPFLFWLLTLLLFVFAIVGEFWTSIYDLKVYEEYGKK